MAALMNSNMGYTTQMLRESVAEGKCLVAVRGKVYDLTKFQKLHPGGIFRLQTAAGRDVTVVLETTHDEEVLTVLKKYHVGYLLDNQFPVFNPPNEFARVLRRRVKEYFKTTARDPKYAPIMLLHYMIPIIGITVCYALLYWSEIVRASSLMTLLLMVVWAWSYFGFTVYWVHDGSHASITHNPKVWDGMGFIYNFLMGFSDIVWFYKHVLGHHPYTNIEGVDPDISVEPFSITRFLPSQKWQSIYILQHIYAPILYGMLTHFSKLQDVLAYWYQSNDKIAVNPWTSSQVFVFWAGKAFFFFYRCVIPLLFSPSSGRRVAITFLFTEAITSWIAAFVFESNHVVEEVLWIKPDNKGVIPIDWVQLQIETAQDYSHGGWITTFLTGSLNYQVAHHVFPQINQAYYPEIAKIMKRTCAEYGVTYRVRTSFWEALGDHIRLLKKMGMAKVYP